MISALFILIAAICNAMMDILENENYYGSVFRNYDDHFWYKRESWKYAKKIFGYKFDAWHIAKSVMIVCLILAAILYEPVFGQLYDFLIGGCIWNIGFVLFYHKLFR